MQLLAVNRRIIRTLLEIVLEHHLRMICDLIKDLVEIPCTESSGLVSVKAVAAAILVLSGGKEQIIRLYAYTKILRQTVLAVGHKYKEKSL